MLIVAPGGLEQGWTSWTCSISATILTPRADQRESGRIRPAHPLLIADGSARPRRSELKEILSRKWISSWSTRRTACRPTGGRRATQDLALRARRAAGFDQPASAADDGTRIPGIETSFQAFLALLDPDRFEARHAARPFTDTTGLMRRMVKENC